MSLGLLGAYDSDSESGSESDREDDVPEPTPTEPVLEALANPFGANGSVLPKPSFMQEQERLQPSVKSDSSVFSNPFRSVQIKRLSDDNANNNFKYKSTP